MEIKKHLPNLLTLANLASGMMIIISSFLLQFQLVATFALFAILFDFLDGFVARLLNVKSEIGKQLDSLADNVSFGAAPALVLFNYYQNEEVMPQVFFMCIFISLFATYRLAKFNITNQSDNYFQGMPTPIYAIAAFSIPLAGEQFEWSNILLTHPVFIILFVFLGGILMLSNLKLLNLKFSSHTKTLNMVRIAFLAMCILLILWLKFFGLFLCLPLYLVFSLTTQKQMT